MLRYGSDMSDEAQPYFAALDTETTGFQDDPDARVVELALAIFGREGQLLRTWSSLVRPEVLTEEGIGVCHRISGIERGQLQDAPEPQAVWETARRLLDDWRLPVRAYGNLFEIDMLSRTFLAPGEELPVRFGECVLLSFAHRFASELGTFEDGQPRYAKLSTALRLAGIAWPEEGPQHRALPDAIACGRLALALDAGLQPAGDAHGTVRLVSPRRGA
jgi:DNA polymerase III epsilon subunit-like protein